MNVGLPDLSEKKEKFNAESTYVKKKNFFLDFLAEQFFFIINFFLKMFDSYACSG